MREASKRRCGCGGARRHPITECSGAVGDMTEPEVLLPVKCPICMQDSLVGFRISVIADAFESGEIRLHANCHVVGWDANTKELEAMVEYFDAAWAADLRNSCSEIPDLDGSSDESNCAFIVAGDLEEFAAEESADEFASLPFTDGSRGTLELMSSDR